MRRPLVAGNWKMNTTRSEARALAAAVASGVADAVASVDVAVCPPFPYLVDVGQAIEGSGVALGAQNAYHEPPGAYTGEVAVEMLVDVGCRWVILGHSERRHILGESDELIRKKIRAARDGGLGVIFCVGELLEERQDGRTEAVLERQMSEGLRDLPAEALDGLVVAYEPVWAIGTGVTATPEQAQSAHVYLRGWLADRYNDQIASAMRILYGGSVKPDNAAGLLAQPDLDGALVGGASLKAESFVSIVKAALDVG